MIKIALFLFVPLMLCLPFYYFNKWLVKKLQPAEQLRRMLLYLLIILPLAFMLVTLCIYVILKGYMWIQSD
ncbi:MAG TPA: hypothetical protein VD996_06630 [Chitinophagaceae bacterium]|nr:hypothetical protein [Chitinophagaceae bacterium]